MTYTQSSTIITRCISQARLRLGKGKLLSLLGAVVIPLNIFSTDAANLPWVSETVDVNMVSAPEIQFDPDGSPVVAYFRNGSTLVYAKMESGTWATEEVDTTLREADELSLAFTSLGHPALAYYDKGERELRYAVRTESVWFSETIRGEVSKLGSLAFSPSGDPGIAFVDSNSALRYTTSKDGNWKETAAVASVVTGSTARLAFAPDGHPAMGFIEASTSEAKYVKFDGTTWAIESVAGNIFVLDFKFLPSGEPAFALVEFPTLKYAVRSNGTWMVTTVDASVGDISLGVTRGGSPAIAYHDFSSNLRYADFDGSLWSAFEVDTLGDFGGFVSIATDSVGQPSITYRVGGDENGAGASIKLASLPIVDPPEVVSISISRNVVTTHFKGEAGITDWKAYSSLNLKDFLTDETPNTVFNETSPGDYRAVTTLTGDPLQFFLTFGR